MSRALGGKMEMCFRIAGRLKSGSSVLRPMDGLRRPDRWRDLVAGGRPSARSAWRARVHSASVSLDKLPQNQNAPGVNGRVDFARRKIDNGGNRHRLKEDAVSSSSPTSSPQDVRPNRYIYWAAILLLFYGFIETGDCLAVIAMQAGLIGNYYPAFIFPEIQHLMETGPIWFLPSFLFFTLLHLWSGVGLWRNRLWGWWMALFVTGAVIIFVPFLLPMSGGDMLIAIILIGLLLIGRFGRHTLPGGAS